eukprot:SAG25_NODE_743_length_5598_cov_5.820149_7_plen_59_part_00
MVFPKEAAHRTVSLFGHLSKVQFIDLNEVREKASEPAAPGASLRCLRCLRVPVRGGGR